MATTTLAVRVLNGLDFPDKKKSKEKSAHCIVSIERQIFETKTWVGDVMEPIWNESFYFDVSHIQPPAPDVYINIEVFVGATIGVKKLGEARIPIDDHIDVKLSLAKEHYYPIDYNRSEFKADKPPTIGVLIGLSEAFGPEGNVDEIPFYTEDQLNSMSSDQIYEAATLVAEKSHALLDRIERMAAQSETIGAATAKQLKQQTEQLKLLDMKVEKLAATVRQGEVLLKDMDSCCLWRCCVVCCAKKKKKKIDKKREKQAAQFEAGLQQDQDDRERAKLEAQEELEKLSEKERRLREKELKKEMKKNPMQPVQLEQTEKERRYRELKEKLDQRLDRLADTVARLKELAGAIGDELDEQQKRIGRLDQNMEDGQTQLAKVNIITKKLQ